MYRHTSAGTSNPIQGRSQGGPLAAQLAPFTNVAAAEVTGENGNAIPDAAFRFSLACSGTVGGLHDPVPRCHRADLL